MNGRPELAVKIDVDTHRGLGEGMPRLLACLARRRVAASVYVAMGPDNSGRAIFRLFRHAGFARKMVRSNALRLYGLRTALYGTLLPAPQIARSFPDVLRRIAAEGHELGVHGYDHVYWHDRAVELSEPEIEREIDAALDRFRDIMGTDSSGFAAPGWQCGPAAVAVLDRRAFSYHSSTRGRAPYRPRAGATLGRLVEIPTTLPTLDELLGQGIAGEHCIDVYLDAIGQGPLDVLTLHAEVEGGAYGGFVDTLLERLEDRVRFRRLADVASAIDAAALPVCDVVQRALPGRAGTVSCQR